MAVRGDSESFCTLFVVLIWQMSICPKQFADQSTCLATRALATRIRLEFYIHYMLCLTSFSCAGISESCGALPLEAFFLLSPNRVWLWVCNISVENTSKTASTVFKNFKGDALWPRSCPPMWPPMAAWICWRYSEVTDKLVRPLAASAATHTECVASI